jgi:hypothetical protein
VDDQELIFEFYTIGKYTKISVIEPEILIEAVIITPSDLDISAKQQLAIKKLNFLKSKKSK